MLNSIIKNMINDFIQKKTPLYFKRRHPKRSDLEIDDLASQRRSLTDR